MKSYDRMINAICREIELRKNEFAGKEISTIYLGGGTPSLLAIPDLHSILDKISVVAKIAPNIEITLEANPDDLDGQKIENLLNAGINRISLGIQSFEDAHLTWMNRSHNAAQATNILDILKVSGIDSINCDLIFALPMLTNDDWKANLEKMYSYNIDHWSCYNLTVEPNTVLHHRISKKKEPNLDDQKGAEQFEILMDFAAEVGMDHYEISNYCQPGKYAVHNTNYWKEVPYVGIGPSAHSFDGRKRFWNVSHNMKYLEAIEKMTAPSHSNELGFEEERTKETIYNEYVMTSLRTKWGCSLERIKAISSSFAAPFLEEVAPYLNGGLVEEKEGVYYLTRAGKLRADNIASDLFMV